ncbi:polysaccharide biosynthesis/export family protein [Pseudoruegeria sp. SHC-113]|uniref:polysaccharide biosynthesis/export family protein n=1 Tax=Pseudoruegeria sp. SHC-113 TaxID=2855439 RepID=UPI0021BABDB6|nr:polysaccharide biosynthesis/export family protein [Pseudoruegeria sp. SHC-113]
MGCTLPRSGPNKEEIYEGSVQRQGDAFIITVNDRVTRATSLVPALGFSQSFQNAGVLGSDTISPGDTLAMTIWENSDVPLLGQEGVNFTQLAEVQVDGSGHIFVPYAGRVRAAGNTPEALRQIITEKLDTQTPDPQVLITRAAGDGSTVSVVGGVAGQGVYPIERPSRTLSGMLAQAGGITTELEITQVNVIRGGKTERIWLTDLYKNPHMDIALRNGDRIVVEEDTRDFTVLGATGAQSRVPFETQTISAIEALALVGGLNSNLADPTGVFVMRNEPAEIANTVLGRSDLQGAQRMVYVLNLTEPNGMFMARDFVIREDDTVYVTEAPYVRWQKTFNAVVGPVNTTASLSQLAN